MNSTLKAALVLIGPAALAGLGAIGFIWWERGAPPGFRPRIHDVGIGEINRDHRGVRLQGMARYDIRSRQEDPNGGPTHYLFPMVPKDEINTKLIRVMVRTKKPPDGMANLEEMTVEGIARPPGRLVPRDLQLSWMKRGYEFDSKFVLVMAFD
jgi:hypothetical protein